MPDLGRVAQNTGMDMTFISQPVLCIDLASSGPGSAAAENRSCH